jgi:hypothetical protein
MINITPWKNKVFFALSLASPHFIFYTFIGLETGWGEAGYYKMYAGYRCFPQVGKIKYLSQEGTVRAVLFYILSQHFFAITISQLFCLILKLAVRLCCLYYPFGQVFGHGGRHTRIMP